MAKAAIAKFRTESLEFAKANHKTAEKLERAFLVLDHLEIHNLKTKQQQHALEAHFVLKGAPRDVDDIKWEAEEGC